MYRPKLLHSMLALLVAAGMLAACGGGPVAAFGDSSAVPPLPAAATHQETAPAPRRNASVPKRSCRIATSQPSATKSDGSPLVVYVGSGDGTLYAIDAKDGKQLWRYASGSERQTGTWLPPTVVDEAVYVDVEQYVHAVAAKDGKQLWR